MSAKHLVPATRCVAHSTRTGEPCKRWAIRGATVCPVHGANKAVRARAAERVALGEAIAANANRSPADVLLHAVAVADELAKRAVAAADGPVTVKQLRSMTDAIDRAGRLASAAVASGLDETWLGRQAEAEIRAQSHVVVRLLRLVLARRGLDYDRVGADLQAAYAVLDAVDPRAAQLESEIMDTGRAAREASRDRERADAAVALETDALRRRVTELEDVVDRQRAAIARARTGLPELPPAQPHRASGPLVNVDDLARWAGGQ